MLFGLLSHFICTLLAMQDAIPTELAHLNWIEICMQDIRIVLFCSLCVWDCADKIDYDFPYYYEYDYDCDNNHYHNPVVLQRVPQPWTEWDKNRKRDKFQMWMRIRVWTVFVCLLLNVTVVFLFISSASGDTVSTSASVLLANFTEYLCVCCMYIEVCKPLLKFLLTVHGSLW